LLLAVAALWWVAALLLAVAALLAGVRRWCLPAVLSEDVNRGKRGPAQRRGWRNPQR